MKTHYLFLLASIPSLAFILACGTPSSPEAEAAAAPAIDPEIAAANELRAKLGLKPLR